MPATKTHQIRFIPSSMADMFLELKYIKDAMQIGLPGMDDILPHVGGDREPETVYYWFELTELGIKNFAEMKPFIESECLQELRRFRIIPPEV
jgi:hypothetical protein